jgi:2-keto-4-pentenoate hydratase/2-oxohepta-3-ene-1,7-dioic acid hydratase in catechol pathway
MLIAQTDHGIARIAVDELEILDHAGLALDDFIIHGRMAELHSLKARTAVGWDEVTLAPPVRRPGKIVIVGLNYRDHAAEIGSPVPEFPRFHLVPGSAVTAGGALVTLPHGASDKVDYEGELAIVIGRTGRDIPENGAWDFVAGATVANDVSARDIQFGDNPALPMSHPALAKGFDGFKPLGPALLTVDELREHDALRITTEVNGVVRQSSSTAELIFSVPQLLAFTSSFLTLEAGDVILTGTPGGTGVAERRFLVPGDVVAVAIEHIGALSNTFVADTTATPGARHER